jgi:hypothetical protein
MIGYGDHFSRLVVALLGIVRGGLRVGVARKHVVEILHGLHHAPLQLCAGCLPVVIVVLSELNGTDSITMFW